MQFDSNLTKWLFFGALIALLLFWAYKKFLNPAAISHDSTLLFTGGLGSGKSLNSVKYAKKSYRRVHGKWKRDCFWIRLKGRFKKVDLDDVEFPEEPALYSNIPIRIGFPDFFHKHDGDVEWQETHFSRRLTRDMMVFKSRLPEGSVVFIDELPQFINQFQFDAKGVKDVLNEWITFFRHYVNGLFIANAQSLEEVECHIRRKLNVYYYCFDFQPLLFGLFYRVRILRNRVGDATVSIDSDYVEDNAKWHYGILAFKAYDSRCYRHRYDYVVDVSYETFHDLCTDTILRFDEGYVSPLEVLKAEYWKAVEAEEALSHD